MDTELIRFRIDAELRLRAAKVCGDLGLELNDVLRTFVTRIARDGTLPVDLGDAPARSAPDRAPFHDYDTRRWSALKPQVDAEVALALLARFIADCSTRMDEAANGGRPDPELTARVAKERDDARKLRKDLDVSNVAAIREVIDKYGPLVRARAG
jgi:addiction module RelB/DinJ family antitoxin